MNNSIHAMPTPKPTNGGMGNRPNVVRSAGVAVVDAQGE